MYLTMGDAKQHSIPNSGTWDYEKPRAKLWEDLDSLGCVRIFLEWMYVRWRWLEVIEDVTASQAWVLYKDNGRPLTNIFDTVMYLSTSAYAKPREI